MSPMSTSQLIDHLDILVHDIQGRGDNAQPVRKMRDAMLRHQMREDRPAWVQSVRRCARRAGA